MESAHTHRASKWQNQDSKPDLLEFKVHAYCTPLSTQMCARVQVFIGPLYTIS